MTTDTIFGTPEGDNQQSATPAKTEDKGMLEALVGEKQKYKSAEELAKAYANADEFINTLKEENRRLKEQTAQAKTLDDVLERINKTKEKQPEDTPAPVLSEDRIAALVEQTLTGRETARTREANLLKADKLMKEQFGEKAVDVFKSKAATPELARVYMDLASQDPSQFVALFASATPQSASVDVGSVSTAVVASPGNRASIEGTKEWASTVRKENPGLYWSGEFQYKMQQMVTKNPNLYFGN